MPPRGEGRPFIPPAELGGILEYFYNAGPSPDCGVRILEFGVQNKEPKPLKKGAMRVDKVIKCDYNYSHDKKRPI